MEMANFWKVIFICFILLFMAKNENFFASSLPTVAVQNSLFFVFERLVSGKDYRAASLKPKFSPVPHVVKPI